MHRNNIQFRYQPRVSIEDIDAHQRCLTIGMIDRNDGSKEAGFSVAYLIDNLIKDDPNRLSDIIQLMLHKILNKIANEKQNLHHEPELHKDCDRPWSYK